MNIYADDTAVILSKQTEQLTIIIQKINNDRKLAVLKINY